MPAEAAAWRLHDGSMAAAWRLCTEQPRWQAVWQAVRRLHGGWLCAGWRRAQADHGGEANEGMTTRLEHHDSTTPSKLATSSGWPAARLKAGCLFSTSYLKSLRGVRREGVRRETREARGARRER